MTLPSLLVRLLLEDHPELSSLPLFRDRDVDFVQSVVLLWILLDYLCKDLE